MEGGWPKGAEHSGTEVPEEGSVKELVSGCKELGREGRDNGGKSEGKEGRKQGERQEEPMRREVETQVQKEQLLTLGKPRKERCPLAWMGLPSWLCLLPTLGPTEARPWTSPHSRGAQRWGSAMTSGLFLLFSVLGPSSILSLA